ncbi:protein PFC0760c-like isoform X2 [Aricia agestis]|uniref:protein PFC0760c-like isoform X2 n=1 Tax=Aricia agestis TaxID=91739 RepID=UPI001C201CB7|nr:protein PFC0760c-like isoform X2 [Aricia agestis]
MILQELDINKLSKLVSQQVYQVTCIECCKLFSIPTTAKCGHTLCHTCWRGRHKCPTCSVDHDKASLKLNLPLQNLTKHVLKLQETFEDLFKIKLEECLLDSHDEVEQDPSKNVTDWLASSQNHFSMPPTNSAQFTQDTSVYVEQVTSHAQVHSENKKKPVPMEVEYVPPKEQDWDRIEEMPEPDNNHKNKANIVGPMDIETFDYIIDDNDKEYTNEKPRRSIRNKENTSNNKSKVSIDMAINANCTSTSSMETNNKSNKTVKTWNNVKKMKKDLNKVKNNKNKLNVSTEMCKKTQGIARKANEAADSQAMYSIDDNTPDIATEKTSVVEKNDSKIVGNVVKSNPENNDSNVPQKEVYQTSVHSHRSTKDNDNVEKNKRSTDNNNIDRPNKSLSNLSNQNKCNSSDNRVIFIKKSTFVAKNKYSKENIVFDGHNVQCVNTDDIEITIKVGNTVANIHIKKKDNDVQLNIQSDKEVQTSLRDVSVQMKKPDSVDIQIEEKISQNQHNIKVNSIHQSQGTTKTDFNNIEKKSASTKKNTASADTATAEITASVEKELFQTMDKNTQQDLNTTVKSTSQALREVEQNVAELNDLDIFDSESVKEGNVQPLKETKNTPSAILVPTYKSSRTVKRSRDDSENEKPNTKKRKSNKKMDVDTIEENSLCEDVPKPNTLECSELDNYNDIISQVFANIDADINHMQKSNNKTATQNEGNNVKRNDNVNTTQKYSENVFSVLGKDSVGLDNEIEKQNESQKSIVCEEKTDNTSKKTSPHNVSDLVVQSTPMQEDTLSGQSVVEETPQKSSSFTKARTRGDSAKNNSKLNINRINSIERHSQRKGSTQRESNVITLCDTVVDISKAADESKGRPTLDTPVTINKFVDQIKYKSTPVAKKSLDFDGESTEEQTFCSSFVAAKTTQEKEFMSKAFEQSYSPSRTLVQKKMAKDLKYCIAGSCLSSQQQLNLKKLCALKNWTFTDKYTKDLTHLVVGVDEENKAQRSVKFMLALSAGRWIVSYEWVAKCLQTQNVADEEEFEALDGTGAAGPRRARLAARPLFAGLAFITHPPFTVLTEDTLKEMVVSAGGTVVEAASGGGAPPLLLAEPEHTQEDRFLCKNIMTLKIWRWSAAWCR